MNPQPETRHHPAAAASSDVKHWPLPGATAAATPTPTHPAPAADDLAAAAAAAGGGWVWRMGRRCTASVGVSLLLLTVWAAPAHADPADPAAPTGAAGGGDGMATLHTLATNARNALVGVAVIELGLVLAFAGIKKMSANGNPGMIAEAKETAWSGVKGFGLIMLAPVLVELLRRLFGAGA
jgi:hypothetical protein